MQKYIVVVTCCALGLMCSAGVRIPGPVTVVDADGGRQYEQVEVHEIVGVIDCVEVIGRKIDGGCERRGYVGSSSARWAVSCTNAVSRPYQDFCGSKCRVNNLPGLDLVWAKVSDTNQVLVVGNGGANKQDDKSLRDPDVVDWEERILVEKETGLNYRQSQCAEFDDGSNDVMLVSLYADEKGAIKIWYEVVDESRVILAKGWCHGTVADGRIVGQREASVMRCDDLRIVVAPIKGTLNASRNNKVWLHFAAKKGNATADVGFMLHVVDTNAASLR